MNKNQNSWLKTAVAMYGIQVPTPYAIYIWPALQKTIGNGFFIIGGLGHIVWKAWLKSGIDSSPRWSMVDDNHILDIHFFSCLEDRPLLNLILDQLKNFQALMSVAMDT